METEALGAVEEVVDVIADSDVAPAGVVERRGVLVEVLIAALLVVGVTWPVVTVVAGAKACQY